MYTIKTNDGFTADFVVLTALELLDVEISPGVTESMALACEVAKSVADWNGRGRVNPNWLISDKANHQYIYAIAQACEEKREKLPKLKVRQEKDHILIYDDNVNIKIKDITILELMDLVSTSRNKNDGDYPSILKCDIVSNLLLDWNGEGVLNPYELRNDKNLHKYVIGIDNALIDFFRRDYTVSESDAVLDNSHNNGRDDNPKPTILATENNSGKGFSINVGGVQESQKN